MLDILKRNKLVALALLVVVLGGIWFVLSGDSGESESLVVSGGADSIKSSEERAALDTLLQLKAIQLDDSVFREPAFLSLRDSRTEIVSEPIGKRNPFAPFSSVASASTTAPAKTVPQQNALQRQ